MDMSFLSFYLRQIATRTALLLLLTFPLRESSAAASFVAGVGSGGGELRVGGGASRTPSFVYVPPAGVEESRRRRIPALLVPHRYRKGRIRPHVTSSALYARRNKNNVVVAATAATHGGEFFGYQVMFDLNGNVIVPSAVNEDDHVGKGSNPILTMMKTKTTPMSTREVLISEDQEDTIRSFRKTRGLLFSWRRKTTIIDGKTTTANAAEDNDNGNVVQVEHLNLTSSWVARVNDDDDDDEGSAGYSLTVTANAPTGTSATLCAATGVASSLKNASSDQFRIETIFALPDNQRLRVMVPVRLPSDDEPSSPSSYSRESRRGPLPLPQPPLIVQEPIVVVWECRFKAAQQQQSSGPSFMSVMDNFNGKDTSATDPGSTDGGGAKNDINDDQRLKLTRVANNFASKTPIPWEPAVPKTTVDHDADKDDDASVQQQSSSGYWGIVPSPRMMLLPGCNITVTHGYRQVYRDNEYDDIEYDETVPTKLEWFLEVGHYLPQRNYIRQVVKRTYSGAGYGVFASSKSSSSSSSSWCYFDTMSIVEQFLEKGKAAGPLSTSSSSL